MFRSEPHALAKPFESRPPLGSLVRAAGGLSVGLTVLCISASTSPLLSILIFAVLLALVAQGLLRRYPHEVLGLCNVITLARMAIVAFLAAAIFDPGLSVWLVFSGACIAFALDGVDGWLARRSGLVSDFGARFDMETDAALAAVLSLLLLLSGTSGPEILILGFMRYGFLLAGVMVPALRADLPESFRRKTICVAQISALIFLLFPLSPTGLLLPVSAGAAMLLIWSFAVDVIWLLRRSA